MSWKIIIVKLGYFRNNYLVHIIDWGHERKGNTNIAFLNRTNYRKSPGENTSKNYYKSNLLFHSQVLKVRAAGTMTIPLCLWISPAFSFPSTLSHHEYIVMLGILSSHKLQKEMAKSWPTWSVSFQNRENFVELQNNTQHETGSWKMRATLTQPLQSLLSEKQKVD